MPSTKRYVKKERKRARSNDSDTDDEFVRVNRKNSRNQFKISEILKNYQNKCFDNSQDRILKYVPEPVKNVFIPYMKHVQIVDMNLNLMNSLLKSKSELLRPELLSKFQDFMNNTVNKMNKFSNDFIEQLASNYSQDTVYETLKASCQEPVVNLDKIQDPDEKPAVILNPPPVSNSLPTNFDSYADFEDSDIDLQISEAWDSIANGDEIKDVKAQELFTNNSCEDDGKKEESNGVFSNNTLKNLQFDDEGYLIIYTDGCCLANGRDNAQAGIGVWFNFNHPLNVAAPARGVPTNNNAEIQAATKAIRIASGINCKKVRICTDSMFLINCMSTWVKNWKRNNWKTAEKQPVKNRESLEELDSVIKLVDSVIWKHILGHKGCPGNEGADALAKRGAQLYRR